MEPHENTQLTANTCTSRKRYKLYLKQGTTFLCGQVVPSLFSSKPLHNLKFQYSTSSKEIKLTYVEDLFILRNLGNNMKQTLSVPFCS